MPHTSPTISTSRSGGAGCSSECRSRRRRQTSGHVIERGTLPSSIQFESAALPLPRFDTEPSERYPYGARSEAAIYVGDLLMAEVPSLGSVDGSLEIVAIARRPGVLSKVAVRPRASGFATAGVLGIGADHLARVSQRLDGERIEVVRWQRSASAYIADALGLGEEPPMVLLPWLRHARVLLGAIDVRGIAGWRGLNTILASALTGWRIRLEPIAETRAWQSLRAAMLARRPLASTVVGFGPSGVRLEVGGLYARLSAPGREMSVGEEVEVRITRMDADEGRIFAHIETKSQLKLF